MTLSVDMRTLSCGLYASAIGPWSWGVRLLFQVFNTARLEAFQVLVHQGVVTCDAFDSTFECIIKHLDAVPWEELFCSIPGNSLVSLCAYIRCVGAAEPVTKRVSLKRLLRRYHSGDTGTIDQSGEWTIVELCSCALPLAGRYYRKCGRG